MPRRCTGCPLPCHRPDMMLRPAKPTYKAMMLDRIVEVFCEVDDFCKAFLPHWEASLLGTGGPAPRGPQPGLSTSEIITLLLVLHSSGFRALFTRFLPSILGL